MPWIIGGAMLGGSLISGAFSKKSGSSPGVMAAHKWGDMIHGGDGYDPGLIEQLNRDWKQRAKVWRGVGKSGLTAIKTSRAHADAGAGQRLASRGLYNTSVLDQLMAENERDERDATISHKERIRMGRELDRMRFRDRIYGWEEMIPRFLASGGGGQPGGSSAQLGSDATTLIAMLLSQGGGNQGGPGPAFTQDWNLPDNPPDGGPGPAFTEPWYEY